MKTTPSLAAAFAAVLLSTSAALAHSPKDSAEQVSSPVSALVPSKIVNPADLPSSFTRQVVNIEFSLDSSGQPQEVKILTKAAPAAKEQIVKAFKQWKFESRQTDGGAKRFILPLDIVPEV